MLIVILAVVLILGMWACGGVSGCGCGGAEVSEAAVLSEMQAAFPGDVTGVKVSGSSGDVQIDVYTDYYPDPDVATSAGGMARIAAQSEAVLSKYPSATITAYVWPQARDFYITRATASYEDGKLSAPMDNYVNDVLE